MSEQEIDTLRQRWEADPSRALTLELAGEYRRSGRPELAVEVLAAGLESHPEHVAARVAKGRCHLELDQAEEAGRELKQVAIEDPSHLVANQLLAEVHIRLGDLDRARDHLGLFELLGGDGAELEALQSRLEEAPASPLTDAEAPPPADVETPLFADVGTPLLADVETPLFADVEPPPLADAPALRPEPSELAAEPLETPPVASPEAELDTVALSSESLARHVASVDGPADSDPFVLLDWIEFDESRYAAALFAEGLFSIPGGTGSAIREPSAMPAAAATAPPATEEPAPTLTLAELYRKQGHREEAVGIFRQILERQPGNVEAARALAELEKDGSWPLSAEDLLGGGAGSRPAGAGGLTADLLRRYRDRLRGRE